MNSFVSFLICVADLRCWDHFSGSTAATGHFHFLATICFLTMFFSVFSSNITPSPSVLNYLFSQCVFACVYESCEEAEKLYLALSEWKCQEVCKRKICVFLLCRFTDLSAFCSANISMCFFVCVRKLLPQSLFLFCLFQSLRRHGCLWVWVKDKCLTLWTDLISAFLPHSLVHSFVLPSFSSSHICWIFSVFAT